MKDEVKKALWILGKYIPSYPLDDMMEFRAALALLREELEQNAMLVNDLTRDMNEYHDKAATAEARLAVKEQMDAEVKK